MKCAVCGREVREGSLCGECMVERVDVAKIDPFEIVQCSKCGFVKVSGKWRDISIEKAVKEVAEKKMSVVEEFSVKDILIDMNLGFVRVSGSILRDQVSVDIPLRYRVKKTTCLRCSREAGGYYESIVQLRAEGRKLTDYELSKAAKIVNEVLKNEIENEKTFLTKIEKRKRGIDFYFGGRDVGRKISQRIAREMGGKIKKSRKIHGREDGREIYRFTYLVRLPAYQNGDVVERESRLYVVKNSRDGKGTDILTGKTANIEASRVVVKSGEMGTGTVVNLDESVAEILKDDGELVRVQKPVGASLGKRVKVFEVNGRYFSFPEDL